VSYLKDRRTKRQILLDIERKLDTLLEEEEQVIMADLYDRIIAGIAAIQSGDTAALQAHVAAIDTHLSAVDDKQLALQGEEDVSVGRLNAIEAGLGKIATAVAPAPAAGGSTPPASGDGTTSTPPADGSGSADVGPGGPAPAAIPAAGVGSETTGQVDTPVTTG
jgi:hypothetical protein